MIWRTALAKVRATEGNVDDAQALVREALPMAMTTEGVDLKGQATADAAFVLSMIGNASEASEQWAAALALFEQKGNVRGP